MIEVLFLGVGAALPMSGQTNSSFLLRTDKARILIDCGPAIMQQLSAVGVSPGEITHIYFTHRHGDHCLGFPMLMLWWALSAPQDATYPVVIAGELTFKSLEQLVAAIFGGDTEHLTGRIERVTLPDRKPSVVQLTPEITLRTQPLNHAEFAPDLGARFEIDGKILVFTGDTSPTDNIIALAREADLLAHDSSYCATLNPEFAAGIYGHSTAQISARNATAAGVRRLALVHVDALYEGKQQALLQEAQRDYSGQVSIPVAGTLFSF
jgi:ribonuclease Z